VALLCVVSAAVFLAAVIERGGESPARAGSGDALREGWPAIRAAIPRVEARVRRTLVLRSSDTAASRTSEVEERIVEVCALLDRADRLIEPHRDPASGELPAGVRERRDDLFPLVVCLADLTRASAFGSPPSAEGE
jgi:hypothetical protein